MQHHARMCMFRHCALARDFGRIQYILHLLNVLKKVDDASFVVLFWKTSVFSFKPLKRALFFKNLFFSVILGLVMKVMKCHYLVRNWLICHLLQQLGVHAWWQASASSSFLSQQLCWARCRLRRQKATIAWSYTCVTCWGCGFYIM